MVSVILVPLVITVIVAVIVSFVGYRRIYYSVQKLNINSIVIEPFDVNYVLDNRLQETAKPLQYSGMTWGEFVELKMDSSSVSRSTPLASKFANLIYCKNSHRSVIASENASSDHCLQEMNNEFMEQWRNNKMNDLCETNANSKIHCFESPNQSKYCVFENVMMNFRKMRIRKNEAGNTQRLWERGFLAADCGYGGKDDIEGYFSQYKPDIEGQSDAVCDYVFNETVVAYSHDNTKHLGHTINDILNVWATLWASNNAMQSKSITFMNIDGFRRGQVYDDHLYQFQHHYKQFFKRIVKASEFFPNKKVCIKELIFFPKPMLLFIGDRSRHSETGPSLPYCTPNITSISNPLFQRWNLQFRSALRSKEHSLKQLKIFRVVVLRKLRYPSSSNQYLSLEYNQTQIFFNQLAVALKVKGRNRLKLYDKCIVEEIDTSSVSLNEQVALIAKSNVLVGLHGSGINALSVHMPIGSKHCCSVVEIFDTGSSRSRIQGYRNAAQSMGHHYNRVDVTVSSQLQHDENTNNNQNKNKNKQAITNIVDIVEESIIYTLKNPTCVLPEAVMFK